MELSELEQRLPAFCRAMHRGSRDVTVERVWRMPGHAGFSYGFTVTVEGDADAQTRDQTSSWFLRLPPPNVKLEGTADVMRQVAVLNALAATEVPHCAVRWSGTEETWFGRPYFVVPVKDGDVPRFTDGGWTTALDDGQRIDMARQAMAALAGLHQVDPAKALLSKDSDGETPSDGSYLGRALSLEDDVARWDRFAAKAAEPERLSLVPRVRRLLMERLPTDSEVGIFHGDFQWGNLLFATEATDQHRQGQLLAVIDFELTGIGATLNDVGWIATFNDPAAWAHTRSVGQWMPRAEELITFYEEARGHAIGDIAWYRALAAYKFAIISGFNLMLHRRGKRHDPMWEEGQHSIEPLLERAVSLLS